MPGSSTPDLVHQFLAGVHGDEENALAAALSWARRAGTSLYLVGGTLRDLLLERARRDVDLALDGDVQALTQAIAAAVPAQTLHHDAFDTATISGRKWTFDIARTRAERYPAPAALPEVRPAPIAEDLGRRDFSVHAMALVLAGPDAGTLLDPYDGRADLQLRLLRMLHPGSFRDDPLRILRLARYSTRLSFAGSPATLAAARLACPYLEVVSGVRLRNELERLFQEPRPEQALFALEELRALRRIYPELSVPATLGEAYTRLRADGGPAPGTSEYLGVLLLGWDRASVERFSERLALERTASSVLRELPEAERRIRALASVADPAQIVERLAPLALAAVRAAAARAGGQAYGIVSNFVRTLRHVEPELRGHDVIELGVPQGPAVGAALAALRSGRLRGQLQGRDDEIRLVQGLVRRAVQAEGVN